MATSAFTFSPKEFRCFDISDATNAGTTGLHASNMNQLDVDSISFPTLNVAQTLDVRSGVGATLKDEDFFQDNKMRIVELGLSGTLHADVGHKMLLQNITNNTQSENGIVAAGHFGTNQLYATGATNNASCLTVVIRSSDHTNQRSLEFAGCVVTNFAISADSITEIPNPNRLTLGLGTLTITADSNFTATGSQVTLNTGTAAASTSVDITPSVNQLTLATGNVTITASANIDPSGVQLAVDTGEVAAITWSEIIPGVDMVWTPIDTN